MRRDSAARHPTRGRRYLADQRGDRTLRSHSRAISWNGLDNIFLPLAAFAQISVYLETPTALLALKLSVLIGLTAIALVWRRGQIVDDSARLGAALALYFFWSVGGWPWLVAPLILLVSYVRLMPTGSSGRPRQ